MAIVDSWGYPVFKGSLDEHDYRNKIRFLINTISPNSYGLARKDKAVEQALQGSDILILDGVYFGLTALLKKRVAINRITGWDAFTHYSKALQRNGGRVFFLGSTETTLDKIRQKFQMQFPGVEVGTYSPPFKPVFAAEDNAEMARRINEFKPDVLFVGMTAPKQETWAFQNKPILDVSVICTIGNVFDWFAGNTKRPNVVWQKLGMEWLVRIFYRREIFKRNIGNQILFFKHLGLDLVGLRKP